MHARGFWAQSGHIQRELIVNSQMMGRYGDLIDPRWRRRTSGSVRFRRKTAVAHFTPIVLPPKLASHDFGTIGGVLPLWRHKIFPAQPSFDRTPSQIGLPVRFMQIRPFPLVSRFLA